LKVKQSKLKVKVPAGVDHGQRLKMRGEGEAGSGGGQNGDLYVQTVVQEHPIFHRQESELICEVPITYTGKVKLKIPAGTPSGKVFRLKSKGIPILGSNPQRRGDQHVRVYIHVPKKLSDEERELLEKLATVQGTTMEYPSGRGFFEKVKDIFS
jgi:molecular chaperone DnaJ